MSPCVELITTGAELLNGNVVNRHAQWLGRELAARGWDLVRDTTVADDPAAIREALLGAVARCEVVIITGGLGPTSDDVTREVAAMWLGTGLVMHEPSRHVVREIYARRNKPLNSLVERHALVVEGTEVLANHHGLAPGEYLQKDGRHLFLLPGPPREFQGVMRDHVLSWVEACRIGRATRRQVFQVAGLGESDLVARLVVRGFDEQAVEVAYCAAPSLVTVRLEEKSGLADAFDRAVMLVREELGDAIFAEREVGMEHVVFDLLKARGQTLAVAESCTGGLLGARITALPGSSTVFRGGVIAYANQVKMGLLGVPETLLASQGAVSDSVARVMAEGVRVCCGADIGVAITGIAGPDGGTLEKPVGLVYIAAAGKGGLLSRELRLAGDRETTREAAVLLALDLVRKGSVRTF